MQAIVPEALSGNRLDQVAATVFPDYSRGRLQTWIKAGALQVNGTPWRSKDKVHEGDKLSLEAELVAEQLHEPEPRELNIVYEDEDVIVLNKPTNTVVHPAVGNRTGTLLNSLLHHCPQLKEIPRAGIVHRLDKDTSGLMVAAKNDIAHRGLAEQFSDHSLDRAYKAVVWGVPKPKAGVIEGNIGRNPRNRKKMAIVTRGGNHAVTHYPT